MPAATMAPSTGPRGLGGFGAKLAAAQALSSSSPNSASESNDDSSPADSLSTSANLKGQISTLGGPPPKKISSNNAPAAIASNVSAIPSQIPAPPVVTPFHFSSLLAGLSQRSNPDPLAPAAQPCASAVIPTSTTVAIPTALPTVTDQTATKSAPTGNPGLSSTAAILSSTRGVANPQPSPIFGSSDGQGLSASAGELPAERALPDPVSVPSANTIAKAITNNSPNNVSNSTRIRELDQSQDAGIEAKPELLADATPGAVSLTPTISTMGVSAFVSDDPSLASVPLSSQPIASELAASTPLNTNPSLEIASQVLAPSVTDDDAANPAVAPATSPGETPTANLQHNTPAPAETENSFLAILHASEQTSAPFTLNAPALNARVKSVAQAAPAKAPPTTSSNFRPSSPAAVPPTPASALSSATKDAESTLGSQTPFSIFFSSPGPGAEAAASTLPKMILPGTGTAFKDSHAISANGPNTNPQTGSHDEAGNASPQNSPGSANSETPSVAASLHHDADSTPGIVGAVVAQSAVAQAPSAPPVSVAPLGAATVSIPGSAPGPLLAPDSPPAAAKPAPPTSETIAAPLASPVQMAQLINRPDLSEMRVEMNTAAFGNVAVRTVVHANDVGLVIGSDKGDLRGFLQGDMPAIASTLQEQNLRLHTVNFMQGFAFSNNSGGAGSGDSQPPSFSQGRASPDSALSEAANPSTELPPMANFSGGGLSILA